MLLLLTNKFNIGIKPRLSPHPHFLRPSVLPPLTSEYSCYALQSQSRKDGWTGEARVSSYCHSIATVKLLVFFFVVVVVLNNYYY